LSYSIPKTSISSQRTENDIWKGLFEFPVEEAVGQWSIDNSKFLQKINYRQSSIDHRLSYKQTLSHQYINGHFYEIRLSKLPKLEKSYLKIEKKNILNLCLSKNYTLLFGR
jgi:adenine-specific DNA glycosylase